MMDKELIDIVDLNDKPTGQTIDREQAHKQHVVHRIAAVLVFRPNGKLLVQKHKYHDRLLDHSVGGHVSAGETYEQAAKREMKEELNLDIPIKEVALGIVSVEIYPKTGADSTHTFGVFTGFVGADWHLQETEEVDQLVEMGVEELVNLMNTKPNLFLQGFMTSLGAYLRVIKSPLKIIAHGKNWGEL